MKKNAHYVGVDEKYIPEDEKYVDNSVNDELKGMVNDGLKSAKDYISDKDNQEKIKNTGRKGLKILKGVGIGYLAFFLLVIVLVITIFVITFTSMAKINKNKDDNMNKVNNIIDTAIDKTQGNESADISSQNASSFNSDLEMYIGTRYGNSVSRLLDNVVTKIKKNSNYSIKVLYETEVLTVPEDIVNLKKKLEDTKKYEISFDYDANGFINKVTITNY